MNVEVVQEGEEGTLPITLGPAQHLLVHIVRSFAYSERSAVLTGALGVLVPPGVQPQIAQGSRDFALIAAVEIKARDFSPVEGAGEGVSRGGEVILEVNEATSSPTPSLKYTRLAENAPVR